LPLTFKEHGSPATLPASTLPNHFCHVEAASSADWESREEVAVDLGRRGIRPHVALGAPGAADCRSIRPSPAPYCASTGTVTREIDCKTVPHLGVGRIRLPDFPPTGFGAQRIYATETSMFSVYAPSFSTGFVMSLSTIGRGLDGSVRGARAASG
jgi:hypothetical protein